MQVEDVVRYHFDIHGHEWQEGDILSCDLSNDDVQEVKSSRRNMNVFSLRFTGCSLVYPVAIIRHLTMKPDWKPLLREILDDLQ